MPNILFGKVDMGNIYLYFMTGNSDNDIMDRRIILERRLK